MGRPFAWLIDEPHESTLEVDSDYFGNVVWPVLAHCFPQFEATRCRSTLVRLYDQNGFDGSVIIGPGAGDLENFHMLSGFSGHSLMHAPGCGRSMAELILRGRYETIDLSRFGWQRLPEHTPIGKQGIV